MEIGQQVKKLRKERGWSQQKLAAFAGISRQYLMQLESKTIIVNPTFEVLHKIASACGCDLEVNFKFSKKDAWPHQYPKEITD